MTIERGPSGPDGPPIEDRITAALMSVSSRIDVAPRAFEPGAASPPRPRSTEPVRSPLRWVAVAAFVVGVAGSVMLSQGPVRDDVVTTGGEDSGSPVDYEAPTDGTVDPAFADYVAPINGEEGRSAERLFLYGYGWARAETITACLKGGGLEDGESSWALATTDWFAVHEPSAKVRLPSLRSLADSGLDRPGQDLVSREVSDAVARCAELDASKASRWMRHVERLQDAFAVSVDGVIAVVEAGPTWNGVRRCMTESGAPATDERGQPHARIGDYLAWLTDVRAGAGSPEMDAFVECAEPFYAEVEEALVEPRHVFLADHHDELLRLQDEFASFA